MEYNFELSKEGHKYLKEASRVLGMTLEEVIYTGLKLVVLYAQVKKTGNKLIIRDVEKKTDRELIL